MIGRITIILNVLPCSFVPRKLELIYFRNLCIFYKRNLHYAVRHQKSSLLTNSILQTYWYYHKINRHAPWYALFEQQTVSVVCSILKAQLDQISVRTKHIKLVKIQSKQLAKISVLLKCLFIHLNDKMKYPNDQSNPLS